MPRKSFGSAATARHSERLSGSAFQGAVTLTLLGRSDSVNEWGTREAGMGSAVMYWVGAKLRRIGVDLNFVIDPLHSLGWRARRKATLERRQEAERNRHLS